MKQSDFYSGKQQAKYLNNNPIARYLVGNFFASIEELLKKTGSPGDILEIGCGEGHVTDIIVNTFNNSNITITDIAEKMVKLTQERLNNLGGIEYGTENAENLSFHFNSFDCIVACEVFEHLANPDLALSGIYDRLRTGGYILFSVPREPLWRMLNMIRLKYISRFGNTLGHINHWSGKEFMEFIEKNFKIIDYRLPLPWTIILAKKI